MGHSNSRRQRSSTVSSTQSSRTQNSTSSNSEVPPKSTNIRLLTVNCCGIRTNKAEFNAATEYVKPDLICGTESWLRGVKPGKDPDKNAIKSSEVFPPSYTVHRNDRATGTGGGVFTATREGLIADAQPDLTTDCEIVWTKVKARNKKDIYLCSYYMPHRNLNDIARLDESLKEVTNHKKGKHIILAGDFNCPDINWEEMTVNKGAADREVQQALLDLTTEHGLSQIHDQPTRDNNLLDLVFTNNPSIVKSSTSVPGISDHAMVVTDIDIIPQYIKQKPRKLYIFSKANWDNIYDDMDTLSRKITTSPSSSTIEDLWCSFKSGIEQSMDRNIPTKVCKNRKSLPWYNRNLKRMVRRKSRLYKHAKKSNQWGSFKAFQKTCKKAFKKAEINHINNVIQKGLSENNSKPFWRYVKSRRQDSIGVSPLKKMGQLVNDGKGKAQILVEQFQSVFTRDDDQQLPDTKKRAKRPISPLHITTNGVQKLLQGINISKAQGPDKIANIMLKTCAIQLAPALSTIFQRSIDLGKLPSDWLNANISPVYKKGDVHLPENYRPVSLTCVSCKILEHIICKHILDHLESNKIFTQLNHGFRSGPNYSRLSMTSLGSSIVDLKST